MIYIKLRFWRLWEKYVIGLFKHDREPYYIGKTQLHDVDTIESKLIDIGYQPDYFSFEDKGQMTSMRIIYILDFKWRQVHVRVFDDWSVTIHDELTYEEDVDGHINGVSVRMPSIENVAKVTGALDVVSL